MGAAYDRYAHTKGTGARGRSRGGGARVAAGPASARRRVRYRTPRLGAGGSWDRGARHRHQPPIHRHRPLPRQRRAGPRWAFAHRRPSSAAMPGRWRSTAEFDAVICLCQGAFGMMTAAGEDAAVVAGMARALRPGGRLALSAFNAYFAVKYHDDATFDAGSGVSHEVTEIRSETGEVVRRRSVDGVLHASRAALAARRRRVRRRHDLQRRTGRLRLRRAHRRVPRVPRHRPSRLQSSRISVAERPKSANFRR